MDILVLNKLYQTIKTISNYHSLIWTIRYTEVGDFELYVTLSPDILTYIKEGNYLYLKDSDRLMIIEDIESNTNPTDGSFLLVTGRSLSSILTRRIIWKETILKGSLQDGIERLLNENVINPIIPERKIDNFEFLKSLDPKITSKTIDVKYWGDDLYETIEELCSESRLGFKIILTDDNRFVFSLYDGEDRTYDQLMNPYVIFSPDFENLKNSSYLESSKGYKNITLIKGSAMITIETEEGAGSGLGRREIFTDTTKDGTTKGKEILNENKMIKVLEGNADFTKTFVYGEDFDIGDIVQIKNEQGFDNRMRITEVIFSQDMTGYNIYPTFEIEEGI